MGFSLASLMKYILIWISNSPHPVSVTSNGGSSIATPQVSSEETKYNQSYERVFVHPSVPGLE